MVHGAGGGSGGPVPVVAGTVEKRDVPIYLDGLGTVQAFNTVTIRARVDGELTQVAFTEGQEVKKGDLLATIDPRPLQALVNQADARKKVDEAQLANARLVLSRNEDLLKRKVLDQQTFDTSKFQADQLAATVQSDQAALDSAQVQLDYTRIVAPIDGRVGVRQVDAGNIVRAGDAGSIVVLTQLHPISVLFTLPEANLRDVNRQFAAGPLRVVAVDRANVTPLGEGELAVVDNQIDQTTGTVRLKATFANEDNALWPGQFVNARLLLTTRRDGVVVPASVVQRGPNGTYAFLIKGGPDRRDAPHQGRPERGRVGVARRRPPARRPGRGGRSIQAPARLKGRSSGRRPERSKPSSRQGSSKPEGRGGKKAPPAGLSFVPTATLDFRRFSLA